MRRRAHDHLLDEGGGDEVLRSLVTEAVGNALDRRRRGLLIESAITAALVALTVALILTLWVGEQTKSDAHANSAYNCRLLTDVAQVMGAGSKQDRQLRAGGFVSTDANLRRQQALNAQQIARLRPGVLKRLFQDPETVRLSRKSQILEAWTTRYWTGVLIPRLEAAAKANCVKLAG